MTPRIDALRREYANLFKLDVGRHAAKARAMGIRATPTTLLIEHGKVLKALVGGGAVMAVRVYLRRR
jgi:hypothetical protein